MAGLITRAINACNVFFCRVTSKSVERLEVIIAVVIVMNDKAFCEIVKRHATWYYHIMKYKCW
jgi:hypothetical protein